MRVTRHPSRSISPGSMTKLNEHHNESPAMVPSADKMLTQVLKGLEGTKYASTSLDPLAGGTGNFLYRAQLCHPLDDSTKEVVVKHGEGFAASSPNFQLPTDRCLIEAKCLSALASFPVESKITQPFSFVVKTPKCLLYDESTCTQIQELLPNAMDLKTYSLKYYASPTPDALEPQCRQFGAALGSWLHEFHRWSGQQSDLVQTTANNRDMRKIKHMINFQWLSQRLEKFPSTLAEAKEVFEEVSNMAAAEMDDDKLLPVIHGDFWTGNILVPNDPLQEGRKVNAYVIDWELAQLGVPNLDVGQMFAELYELWLYKKITAGLWMAQGFVEGYGKVSDQFAFRTAIQVGAHLVCFGTSVQGWGTPEQVEEVARTGKDIIVNAWRKNRTWFAGGDLACLFSPAE
ncbi:kinase-like domain-containing protein [Pseudomassariella vexata]|uniref:Kinase-like domain-containing protein n=1 Tax=Pseudomassariella vexata TaxID=1141098 RepID=A0A1Y2EDM6_9PEZI|nr:kinase-like domain-containing protein [Pseudomassariella vexata]ORY69660.1 kinase-like domain-containing protein [Pseudomassariella vexata]